MWGGWGAGRRQGLVGEGLLGRDGLRGAHLARLHRCRLLLLLDRAAAAMVGRAPLAGGLVPRWREEGWAQGAGGGGRGRCQKRLYRRNAGPGEGRWGQRLYSAPHGAHGATRFPSQGRRPPAPSPLLPHPQTSSGGGDQQTSRCASPLQPPEAPPGA